MATSSIVTATCATVTREQRRESLDASRHSPPARGGCHRLCATQALDALALEGRRHLRRTNLDARLPFLASLQFACSDQSRLLLGFASTQGDPPAVWFAYSENRKGLHPQAKRRLVALYRSAGPF